VRRTTPRGTVGPCGKIGRHRDRRLVVGTTLTRVTKAMTGNRRATSEHRAALEAMVFINQSVRWAAASSTGASTGSQGSRRLECVLRHVTSAERQGAVAEHQKLRGPRRSRLRHAGRGLTRRSKRGPTALHLARAAPVVHDAPRGQGAIPLVPPHLER